MARRGENIYKRKDGRWEGRYIKCRDVSGKAIYGYVYSRTYAETKEKLTKISAEVKSKTYNPTSKNLSAYALEWLETVLLYCKQSTYVKYHNIVHKHIITELGNLIISEI